MGIHHHHHHHHETSEMSEKKLRWAVMANVLLTVGQIVGGVVSGSLSLVADAIHNLSDAASLYIAMFAERIGRKPADQQKTFGYKRAGTIAALINLTTLILIGVFLCYEAVLRFINPSPIAGWIVIWVAGLALAVDLFTAYLTYRSSKDSMNIRAAFLHNLADAAASVGVIISGTLILLYGWLWVDPLMTIIIAAYILWHGVSEMPNVIHLLMEGAPEGVKIDALVERLEKVSGVGRVYHVHVWKIEEHRNALEAHVVISRDQDMEAIKFELKKILDEDFGICHSTLEFEWQS
ncbi:cation transporter [bacterium]|nr:cation transporter [bacterium]